MARLLPSIMAALMVACSASPGSVGPAGAGDAVASERFTISPAAPATADDLAALLDGQPTPARWEKDGVEIVDLAGTVPADWTAKNQTWRAFTTLPGGAVLTAHVVIGNSAPRCELVTLAASPDGFGCECALRFDADPTDAAADTCAFLVDGAPAGDEGPCLLARGDAAKGQAVTCALRPSDGEVDGAVGTSAPVLAPNQPPPAPEVSLSPDKGTAATTFTCLATAADPDGDAVTYSVHWLVNDYEDPAAGEYEVQPTALSRGPSGDKARRGDAIRCRAQASDGEADSSAVDSAGVTLDNAPPAIMAPAIEPATATEATTLACIPGAASDADGDVVTASLAWFVAGTPAGDGATLSGASFDKDQTVTCAATPYDGIEAGAPAASSNSVLVLNTLPSLAAATLAPAAVQSGGTFTCGAVGWSDADPADAEDVGWSWHTDAGPIDGAVSAIFTPSGLKPGSTVFCRATPRNGAAEGEPKSSPPGTLLNTAPALGGAALGPTSATAASVLTCTAFGFVDPDGDAAVLTYAWEKNGQQLTAATGDTLAGVFTKGDAVRCIVTPGDGAGVGVAVASKPVVILNAVPIATGVTVVPAEGAPCDVFTCQVGGVDDPDWQDVPTLAFRWERNGATDGEAVATFPGAATTPGDVLRCFVTASDGAPGPEVGSTTATVVNSPPAADSVLLSPASPVPGDTLTCQPSGFHDAECDLPAAFVFEWAADGATVDGADGPTLDTTGQPAGTVLACTARPTDGVAVGEPVTSNAVTLVTLAEDAPIVAVALEDDGGVTCAVVKGTPDEAWTFSWQVNGGAALSAGPSLAAGDVHDCDRVRCFVTTGEGTTSNTAERLLPVGPACEDGNPCTTASCQPSGGCLAVPAAAACDDGEPCTSGDACQGGLCKPGGPTACDDGNPCTDDGCTPGAGCTNAANSLPCDADGSLCTASDACSAGECLPGAPAVCDDQNPCTADGCDALAGCTATPAAGSCDDANACTEADVCKGGACGGAPVPDETSCAGGLGRCVAGGCEEDVAPAIVAVTMAPKTPHTGQVVTCSATAIDPDGWPEAVTTTWVWTVDGEVVAGETSSTFAGGFARGQTLACEATASDGLLTSAPSAATALIANAPPVFTAAPKVAGAAGGAPTADADLLCAFEAADPDGDPIQATYLWHVDGALVIGASSATLAASKVSGCNAVKCTATASDGAAKASQPSSPVVLPAGADCGADVCLVYSCKDAGGCTSVPSAAPCDDADACTEGDTCQGGACLGQPTSCDDGKPCTTDTCDKVAGCQTTPNTAPCDDGSLCTVNDTCQGGQCVPGQPASCVDSLACMTADTCAPDVGCLAQTPVPDDFGLVLVTKKSGGIVEPVLDAQPLEIVQGPQGGIHLVGAFKATLPASVTWSPVTVRVEAETRQPCCAAGTQVGSAFYASSALFSATGFVSGSLPVPFFKADAKLYKDKTCCLSFKVSVLPQSGGDPIFVSFARHVFTCVDKE